VKSTQLCLHGIKLGDRWLVDVHWHDVNHCKLNLGKMKDAIHYACYQDAAIARAVFEHASGLMLDVVRL